MEIKGIHYHCTNGAHHSSLCCETCWNRHPLAKENVTFIYSDDYKKVLKEDFIKRATKVKFTKKQAEFLYKEFS